MSLALFERDKKTLKYRSGDTVYQKPLKQHYRHVVLASLYGVHRGVVHLVKYKLSGKRAHVGVATRGGHRCEDPAL